MTTLDFGISVRPTSPAEDLDGVQQVEDEGFDTAVFGDSQNAFASPFVRMGAAAQRTTRIRLATCGVPCHTRHPAMAAAEAATVHQYSGGRAVLGIARGDSALSLLGRTFPAPLAEYDVFARAVRGYLRGEPVELDGHTSRLSWPPKDLPPVPLDMACSGPRAIAQAAALADRVSFAVGSDAERVAWAVDVARKAIAAAGRDPQEVQFGAYVNVAVDDDAEAAAELMRAPIGYSAHFVAMRETDTSEHPPELRRISEPLRTAFLTRDRTPGQVIDTRFARWWGAIGTPEHVTDKLAALVDLGLRHFYLLNATTADLAFADASRTRLATEVLPELRRRFSRGAR